MSNTIPGPVMPAPAVPMGLSQADIQAERNAYGAKQDAAHQRDIEAGRASVASELAKQRLSPAHVHAKDMSVADAGAQAAAGVAQAKVDALVYVDDKVSKSDPNIRTTALDFRIAKAECPHCSSTTQVAQHLPLNGDAWTNDPQVCLPKFGWVFDGARWFCGDTCRRWWTQRMTPYANGVQQPIAVTHVNDQAYARKAYAVAAPAPVSAPAQVTLPQHGAKPGKR